MAVWFVSRHEGTILWAHQQALAVDHWVTHLDVTNIATGDVVMGTLPVHLAAKVCERGAKFYFVSLILTQSQRGQELSVDDMLGAQCRLQCFDVSRCDSQGG